MTTSYYPPTAPSSAARTATPALHCRQIAKSYGKNRLLFDALDLTLAPGEFVAVMGESGVGKSTLLNLIGGLDRPDSGDIEIDGESLAGLSDNAATLLRRRKIGFIFQAFHLLPHLSLMQNVALPLLINGLPPGAAQASLAAVGLHARRDDFPRQLSGGESQRVAIARALVHRPRLILADEPTGNLDPETADTVLARLREHTGTHSAAVLMVTHSQAAAARADRIVVLRDGRLHAYDAC